MCVCVCVWCREDFNNLHLSIRQLENMRNFFYQESKLSGNKITLIIKSESSFSNIIDIITHNKGNIFICYMCQAFSLILRGPVGWGCRIHRLQHFCRGARPTTTNNKCPGYDTKQSDDDAPLILQYEEYGEPLYCDCSQVHSDPEWSYRVGSFLWVK